VSFFRKAFGGLSSWAVASWQSTQNAIANAARQAELTSAYNNLKGVGGKATSKLSGHVGDVVGEETWNKAKPFVAGLAGMAVGGLAGSAAFNTGAASSVSGLTAGGVGYDWARDTRNDVIQGREDDAAADGYNAAIKADANQKELDAKIVSEAAAADKKRRAQMLANSRKGTIKTSPLGLPGGGFAQKQLLGA
jgi:hypothetical protein